MKLKKSINLGDSMSKNFEKSISELEKLVAEMENGNITLDESIDKFEKGMQLIKECKDALQAARGRVEKILEDGSRAVFENEN